MQFIVAALLSSVLGWCTEAALCWSCSEGSCYAVGSQGSVHSAEAECSKEGARMVSIGSQEENDFVRKICGGRACWLGFKEKPGTETWEWADGVPAIYTNWAPGEPNNHNGDQEYSIMNMLDCCGDTGKWADYPPDVGNWNGGCTFALCEIPGTGNSTCVPEVKECFDPWNTGACSMDACTSHNDPSGFDCWAGSDVEECSCSQGEAKLTGESGLYKGKMYYEYTCCTDGSGSGTGAKCADCCIDSWAILGITFVWLCGGAACFIAIGVFCRYKMKCCCWHQSAPAVIQPGVYSAPNVVVGQPAQGNHGEIMLSNSYLVPSKSP
ncbi:unnamed protein product [Polarella glacialis]|uniref:C-type lectin domain-containing protein n=1 Tax=Polarella glacialis TaxID=89957 RepID=A0A813LH34_POLGL|nr:unnamed protein product [Polarella glacialis]